VALNSPTLWRDLPSSIPWAREMLERSKPVGLGIQLTLSYSDSSSPRVLFWKDVLCNHAARIRELELTDVSKSTSLVLLGDLQPSSLSLHSLQICQSTQQDNPTFPTAAMQAHQLRSLSVKGYEGAWYSLPLSCLTNLKIHNIHSRPRLDDFIKTLQANPHLQTIDIEDSLPSAFEAMGSTASVNLPRLGILRLSSTRNPKEVSNILSCIAVPSTATLEIKCRNRDSAQNDQEALIELASSLSLFFSAMSKSANHDVSYEDVHLVATDSHLRLSAWECCTHWSGIRPQNWNLYLAIELRTRQSAQEMLGEIFPALPLLSIKSLTLELDDANILAKKSLRNLSCLQNVNLIGNCTFGFMTALVDKPQDYHSQSSAYYSVSFPKLRTLCITATSCGPDGVCPIDYLCDCLMERYERRAELTKLTIQECYGVEYDDVKLLKEIVVDVEWDGLEISTGGRETRRRTLDSEFEPYYFFLKLFTP